MIVMRVVGELDVANGPMFERRLAEAQQSHAARVIVDLSDLDFIDSTGLNALVRAHARGDGRLIVLRGSDAVHRPFVLTGLDRLLPFADRASISTGPATYGPAVRWIRAQASTSMAEGLARGEGRA